MDRNKFYANALQKPLALLYKERDYSKVTKNAADSNIKEMRLLGEVKGKTIFMADDMIGTGGTLIKGMKNLKDMGAARVICAVSLPLFSGSAIEDFEAAYKQGLFYRIIGTNAVHHKELLQKEWYIQADVTGLFAQIISLVHHNRSVSSMLDNRELVAKRIKKQVERMSKGTRGHPRPRRGGAPTGRSDASPPRSRRRAPATERPGAMKVVAIEGEPSALVFDLDNTLYTNPAYAAFQEDVLVGAPRARARHRGPRPRRPSSPPCAPSARARASGRRASASSSRPSASR